MVPEAAAPCGRARDLVDVVDEDVELALVGSHPLEQRGDLVVVAVIGLDRNPGAARLVDQRRGAVDRELAVTGAATGDVHGGALLAERDCGPAADPATRPGDHGDLAVQCAAHRSLPADVADGVTVTSSRLSPRSRKLGK